ncbi:polysaccharide pyruvyl transferase family protein [Priestia aryabhattai]|uniref:polysaccharide pyruvyl transferase family protein n=1 Tax=Priestia aryabhattai TaxID=412384 RepID=UPI001C8DED42|nr:polysaccharide pyruvyl transferase family protein [Priestia aryabhattai]MBX9987785.1 polysaccharide pyruvyl transferase family protein [Priestia aryabhattai]
MRTDNIKSVYNHSKFSFKFNHLRKYKHLLFSNMDNFSEGDIEILKTQKKMIVMQTPLHGNLGDQAIAYAQKKFIEKYFKDYIYIEISYEEVMRRTKLLKKVINEKDIIFIHGGGNMGDLYLNEEFTRRYIIETFKYNKIITFPQTISFSSSTIGKKELEKTRRVYMSNPNLLLIARENKSFSLMKAQFGTDKVILTPDIVLSLDEKHTTHRQGILTCFRNDEEKVIDVNFKNEIISKLREKYKNLIESDTVVNREISTETREKELDTIWNKFKAAEVVLTDRLHGMIFCAITRTPCIVFNNYNHKIESSYNDWLKDLKYIKFINTNEMTSFEEVNKTIEELKSLHEKQLSHNNYLSDKFRPLIDYIETEELKVNQ